MEVLLGMGSGEAPTNRVWQSERRSHQETSFEGASGYIKPKEKHGGAADRRAQRPGAPNVIDEMPQARGLAGRP